VDRADLHATVSDGKQERRGEGSDQLLEVTPTERGLALASQTKYSAVNRQDAVLKHVLNHAMSHGAVDVRPNVAEPPIPVAQGYATLLQWKRKHLLGEDMGRDRWWLDRLDETVPPELTDAHCDQQRLVVGGEHQAVPGASRPPPGASHALKKRRDAWRRVDLHHAVEVSDIEAKLERAGCDDHAIALVRECCLGAPALVDAKRTMRQEGLHVTGA
jgi:hypothetical protein